MSSHFMIQSFMFSNVTGALEPFAWGFQLFRRSNNMSILLIKSEVASLPTNSSKTTSSHKKSIAFATEELKVCAAKLTFILCFVHKMCFFFNLFANANPRCSCIPFNFSM